MNADTLRRAELWMSATRWRQYNVQVFVGLGLYLFLVRVMHAAVWYAVVAMVAVQVAVVIATPSVAKVAEMRAEDDKKGSE